jgi:hypothetical protein
MAPRLRPRCRRLAIIAKKASLMNKTTFFVTGMFWALSASMLCAQFSLDGQILQRPEYRNGFGRLIERGEDPAVFIGHRARLQAAYQLDFFTFYMSVQDIRVWGNTSQVKATDPFLSVHEAWAETRLGEHWRLKLGRQELNYDNVRFLGNLDWALQGRAHDFALAKFEKGQMKLHFGGGYNQDGQALTGNLFTIPNQYKIAQMVRYENRWKALSFSIFYWNDGRQFVIRDGAGAILRRGIHYRQTIGLPTLRLPFGNTTLSAFYYHQFGEDEAGRPLNAFNASLQITQQFDLDEEKGAKWRLVAGTEWISGTPNDETDKSRAYSPLYGTNHIFNGYMDLFFVGGAFENSVGLQDYFLKSRHDFSARFFAQFDGHAFFAQARVVQNGGTPQARALDPFLGVELDGTLGFILNSAVSIQAGYSQLFASDTFRWLQGAQNSKNLQNWAYLMLIFRPTMPNKFIGILL